MDDLSYEAFKLLDKTAVGTYSVVARQSDIPGNRSLTLGRIFGTAVQSVEQAVKVLKVYISSE